MKNTKNVINKKKFFKIYKTNEDNLLNNNHVAFRYLCYKYMENIRSIEIPEFTQGNELETVFIEFRKFPHTEFIIRNTILKLDNKWSHTIICGNTNYKLIKKICKKISPNIKILKTDFDNLKPSEYSKFLASKDFWDLLCGEKILIYQEDSFIFKENINDFLEFDFIGAPFPKTENDTPNSVGNGGLSLRSKSIMKEVINTITMDGTNFEDSTLNYMTMTNSYIPPEDVYFSKNMQELKIGKVADWKQAFQFSSERIYNPDSFAGHKFWLSNSNWKSQLTIQFNFIEYIFNSNIIDYLKYINLSSSFDKTNLIPNAFDVDIYFCNLVNKLNLKKKEEILRYIKNTGIKGNIYHPKQIVNIYTSARFFNILNNVYIKYSNCIYKADDFVENFIYKLSFEELTSKLIFKKYEKFNKNISLLVLVFIGNEEKGNDLIEKLIEYKKTQRMNVSFCFNSHSIMNNLKFKIKDFFQYYAIYLSKEFGTDITPTLLMYDDISKNHEFKHIIKLHTKSITDQYEDLTKYLLSVPLKTLCLKKHNSNCIGNENYYTILKNDIFNKQLLFSHHTYLNIEKTFVAGTIFYCENIVMQKVVDFVKNNNFKSYLLNNLYENNSINKNYSPIHFLERLFGIINI
jgi:hypothetical protein